MLNVQAIIRFLEKNHICFSCCSQNGEPGYDTPKCGMIFLLDPNEISMELWNILDNDNAVLAYDEWLIDYENDACFRTVPDNYSWKPSFTFVNDELFTRLNLKDVNLTRVYIESLINNPKKADIFGINLEKYGFSRSRFEYRSGWHDGDNDDPEKVLSELLEQNPNGRYVFSYETDQFTTTFTVWKQEDI